MISIRNNIVSGGPAVSVPAHLSVGQYVFEKIRGEEECIAWVNGETSYHSTNKEFLQLSVNLACGLRNLGVTRGVVVCICSENCFEYYVTTIAVLLCGGTVTTASHLYTEAELTHVLSISKPRILIGSTSALKKNLKTFKSLGFLKQIVQFDFYNSENLEGVLLYREISKNQINIEDFQVTDVKGAEDVALILYSSGTTGLPKGVMVTHLNFLTMIRVTLETSHPDYTKYLSIVPSYHGYGLMAPISYMLAGKTIIFMTGFQPERYLSVVQKYKVDVLMTVPPMVVFFIKSPIVDNYDISSVRLVWCAAAPLSTESTNALLKRFPKCLGVMQAYGMTETSLSVTSDRIEWLHKNRAGSGGAPLPGAQVKVVDLKSGKSLGALSPGEVCVKYPGVMLGYAGDAAATAACYDADGYLRTGDIGYYDHDGYFFIVDRLKELIKYKGFQVAPAEVESAVLRHAAVAECGVAGAPHAAAGELTTAFVVLRPQHEPSDALADDIKRSVAQQLSPMKHLHGGVVFVPEIPKNPSGKILRRLLRERLRQQSKL